ncbi:MAG TPA: hypothetical protein VN873_10300 [Candidatus Angelobacter sp.]|nr:hypothetical protein [Candidatus Angelobacter sp.]
MAMLALVGTMPVLADTVTYNFGGVSAGASPAGSPPWVQAVFSDNGQPANTVQLTLNAGNLTGSEFVSSWYFNLNPSLDPTLLTFTQSGSTGSFTDPTVKTGANGFKAGVDGKFDVLVGFNVTGGISDEFTSGDSVTFTITGIGPLTAGDFDQLSTCASGGAQYLAAADIDSISDNDGYGWINPDSAILDDRQQAVPDSSATAGLLGAAVIAMAVLSRKVQIRSSLR